MRNCRLCTIMNYRGRTSCPFLKHPLLLPAPLRPNGHSYRFACLRGQIGCQDTRQKIRICTLRCFGQGQPSPLS